MGKGDTPRPSSVSEEEKSLRWDYAFRKDMPNASYEEWVKAKKEIK